MMFSNEYRHTATHIRGRVFSMGPSSAKGRTKWGMEIVNTRTGQVIASDDCTLWHSIADLADHATGVARAAWFWDLRREAVK